MIYMDSKSANDGTYALTVTFEVGTDQDIAAVDVQNRSPSPSASCRSKCCSKGSRWAKRQPQILLAVAIGSDDPRYGLTVPVQLRDAPCLRRAGTGCTGSARLWCSARATTA